jgi:3',5'-cyclic-AMP phosphodiesterase
LILDFVSSSLQKALFFLVCGAIAKAQRPDTPCLALQAHSERGKVFLSSRLNRTCFAAFKGCMKTTASTQKTNILWLTDLHLDKATGARRSGFYREMRATKADALLITGDISSAKFLPLHLRELAAAASPREVYFVLGNHDFYGSSFAAVDSLVAGVCRAHENLHHLGKGDMIGLPGDTALIGHRGWGDGRMGWGQRSLARNPDFDAIKDFQGLSKTQQFALLRELGRESASYFRKVLPYALTCHRHVIVATHVPPFTRGAHFKGRPCDWLRQPHYSNISAGATILGIAGRFPKSKITILSGHTHCAAQFKASSNIEMRVGGARPGYPEPQAPLDYRMLGG